MSKQPYTRPLKSDSELRRMSFHINYEFQMLGSTAEMLRVPLRLPVAKDLNDAQTNCHLESFCIHARNLFLFLYTKQLFAPDHRPKETDFLAQDFDQKWQANAPTDLKIVYDRVNREIAHLTEFRIEDEKCRKWEIETVKVMIEPEFNRWLRGVDNGKLGAELAAHKASLQKPTVITSAQPTLVIGPAVTSVSTTAPPSVYGFTRKCQ